MKKEEKMRFFGRAMFLTMMAAPLFAGGAWADDPASASAPPSERMLIIAAGEPNGAFLPEAGAICRIVNKELRDDHIVCLIEPSPGSLANIGLLRDGSASMAIVQSGAAAEAYEGQGNFKDSGAFESLRGLFSLHGESVLILVNNASKIDSPAALKGKKINLGPEGGFQRFMSDAVLTALKIPVSELGEALALDPVRQTEALCNQEIDAAIYSGIHPMPEVEEALSQCEVRPLLLDEKTISAYIAQDKTFSKIAIAPGLYQGTDQPILTFGPRALFVATSDVSAADAYRVVKAVFDNHDTFRAMYPLLSDLDKKQMAGETNAIPLHDGARKFYQEEKLR